MSFQIAANDAANDADADVSLFGSRDEGSHFLSLNASKKWYLIV